MSPQIQASSSPLADPWSALKLTAAEWEAVLRQGFVSCKSRGRRGAVYLLRFRRNGKQMARYLGTDPQRAQAIRLALEAGQRPRRLRQRLRKRIRQVRSLLATVKPLLEPHVAATGHYFHGRTIRRRNPARPLRAEKSN